MYFNKSFILEHRNQWWKFNAFCKSMMIKRAVSENCWPERVEHYHSAVAKLTVFLKTGSGRQDHCWWAEAGHHHHQQQGWAASVHFSGLVCWRTGGFYLQQPFLPGMSCSRWLFPITYNIWNLMVTVLQIWGGIKYDFKSIASASKATPGYNSCLFSHHRLSLLATLTTWSGCGRWPLEPDRRLF